MKTKEIQDTLVDWYSPNVATQLRVLQLIMMGYGMTEEDVKKSVSPAILGISTGTSGQLLYFPPILRSFNEMRQSNPILKNMRILASQVRGIDVTPDWQGVPSYINTARKAWWNTRAKGMDGYTAFKNDTDSAFIDFSMLGIGYMKICVNESEGVQRATAKYVSPLDVISDPYLDVDDSNGVGIVTMMGKDEFISKFPESKFEEHKQSFSNPAGFTSTAVRVIEWYDHEKYVAFPNNFTNEPIYSGENPYGCIPLQSYVNFKPSGSLMPMGLIEMQLASAIDIVQMTNDIRLKARNDGFIAIEPGFFTPESLEEYAKNKNKLEYLQIDSEKARALYQLGAKPFIEMPRVGANPDVMNLLNISINDNREQSAVSATAAGVQSSGDATATEIRSIDSRMDSQYRALLRTFTRSHAGFAVKLAKVAERYDNAPFTMNYMGTSIEFNDGDPRTTSELIWQGSKIPLFEDETLFSQDAASRMVNETMKFEKIFAMTQSPEAIKSMIEAMGVENVDKYIPQPQTPMPGMGMPGMEGLPPELAGMMPQESQAMMSEAMPTQDLGGGQQPPIA